MSTIGQLLNLGGYGVLAYFLARWLWPRIKKLDDLRVRKKKIANGYRFEITWR